MQLLTQHLEDREVLKSSVESMFRVSLPAFRLWFNGARCCVVVMQPS